MARSWRLALASAALCGAIAAVLLWLGPPGSDTAAHVYQRDLFRSARFVTWDNYWYSGRHVFITYSLLYYPLASVVGINLLALLSLAAAAAAFALLVDWTPAALAFAVAWGAYAISGAYPFMLGTTFALAALLARRTRLFGPLGVFTWLASPLALLLLAVVVAGARWWRALALLVPPIATQLVLVHLYPEGGSFPFPWDEWLAVIVFAAGGAALARDRTLRGIFTAYLVLVLLAFPFQSQLGENATRLRFMALPLGLLALRGRSLRLVVPLVAACAVYNATPLAWSFAKGTHERANHSAYWAPALAFLRAHEDPNYRVNALDTVGHWEAVYLPEAGFAITRGWYRQDDFPENELLYRDDLTLAKYVHWLHERAVRYVLVPDDRLDYSSVREAKVAVKLPFVKRCGRVAVYEVPDPVQIAPRAEILQLAHQAVTLRVTRAGRYALAIRGHGTFRAPGAGVYTLAFS